MSPEQTPLQNVAIIGARGNIGAGLLDVLLHSNVHSFQPTVTALVRPSSDRDPAAGLPTSPHLRAFTVDLKDRQALVSALNGQDAVISVLGGPGIALQYDIFDACIQAGVKRFYPSEFGQHQIYTPVGANPSEQWGLVHPMWNEKRLFNDHVRRHPAVQAGKISYTLIGGGDFFDQPWEPVWCPWAGQHPAKGEAYEVLIVGNGDAKIDWSFRSDIGQLLVATLARPVDSANRTLNFPSDCISMNEICSLLESYSGRRVRKVHVSLEEAKEVIDNPDRAPKEVAESSKIPVQFWYVVKSGQGSGRGWRPKEENCHEMWGEVKRTSVEQWMRETFGSA